MNTILFNNNFNFAPALSVAGWKNELAMIKEHYAKFGDRLPQELVKQLEALEARLA